MRTAVANARRIPGSDRPVRQIERPVTDTGEPSPDVGSRHRPSKFSESEMNFCPGQMIGGSVLGRLCQHTTEVDRNATVASAGFSTGGIRTSRDGHRHSFDAANANI